MFISILYRSIDQKLSQQNIQEWPLKQLPCVTNALNPVDFMEMEKAGKRARAGALKREQGAKCQQVVRYTALIGGILYGLVHQGTLQKQHDEHRVSRLPSLILFRQQSQTGSLLARSAKEARSWRPRAGNAEIGACFSPAVSGTGRINAHPMGVVELSRWWTSIS